MGIKKKEKKVVKSVEKKPVVKGASVTEVKPEVKKVDIKPIEVPKPPLTAVKFEGQVIEVDEKEIIANHPNALVAAFGFMVGALIFLAGVGAGFVALSSMVASVVGVCIILAIIGILVGVGFMEMCYNNMFLKTKVLVKKKEKMDYGY